MHQRSYPRLVAAVGVAEEWDAAQLSCGGGPLLEALESDEVLILDPFDPADFEGLARSGPTPRSVVVLPGAWTDEGGLATTLYLGEEPGTEAIEALGEYEPLLAHALGLLEYCGDAETRADQMLQMMQYRRVIEQAKGMVMTRRALGADEAFTRLAEISQQRNVRLRELAVALVESVGGAPAEQPDDIDARTDATPEAVDAAKRFWDDLQAMPADD